MATEPEIHSYFDAGTSTWQYIVADRETRDAVIIDPVLNFDPVTAGVSTTSADELLAHIAQSGYNVQRILETHAHADHLTAAGYLQRELLNRSGSRPPVCIGKRISEVQSTFAGRYGIDAQELTGAFDKLLEDDERFSLGNLSCTVIPLPGHTPDHVGYIIGGNAFTGDSIFNPYLGTARADFPGGSASSLYRSVKTLLSLPPDYRLYVGHDYPPDGKQGPVAFTTVAEQNSTNKHIKHDTTEEEFTKLRRDRDSALSEPKLLHQALQVNIRGGRMPERSQAGYRFLQIPLRLPLSLQ
ncbi:hypothetical protein FGG08_003421 [Glutinoglossum americanum]|uniref:Metallo-beta-lactamase domain-containing protein n=1 Tax=Glutinoglossum americanum TaxID=1670608 RepID=A0A9P8ID89_9PEZI|nr:hypothetical protein FGG08_003421 [Glutinoglossum americanum]